MNRTFVEVKGADGKIFAIDIDRVVSFVPMNDGVRLILDDSLTDDIEERVVPLDSSEYERLCNLLCIDGGRR